MNHLFTASCSNCPLNSGQVSCGWWLTDLKKKDKNFQSTCKINVKDTVSSKPQWKHGKHTEVTEFSNSNIELSRNCEDSYIAVSKVFVPDPWLCSLGGSLQASVPYHYFGSFLFPFPTGMVLRTSWHNPGALFSFFGLTSRLSGS